MRIAVVIFAWSLALASGVIAGGCATGGASGDSTPLDAGQKDSTAMDAPRTDTGTCPTGHTGPDCQSCASGFHACGSTCEQDHANVPTNGCTQGCNSTACPAPQNSTAKCTSDGHCDFACNTSFDKTDAGCDCPAGQMDCTGTCQQCCVDNDCIGHQLCTAGVCGGCQPGWGDCNKNPADGCELHLDTTSNCGSCGHGCCGSFCGCGFLGTGGEKCNVSGASFACGC